MFDGLSQLSNVERLRKDEIDLQSLGNANADFSNPLVECVGLDECDAGRSIHTEQPHHAVVATGRKNGAERDAERHVDVTGTPNAGGCANEVTWARLS